MEYITLDKGIPVWIPAYEASLQFRIAKLGDTLDSLLFMILYMKMITNQLKILWRS